MAWAVGIGNFQLEWFGILALPFLWRTARSFFPEGAEG
jgi:hypothetical protein